MNVRIQYPIRFLAAVHYDGRIQMNEYTVKVYMMTNTEDPADHNIALNRIKYFVYSELENTVFINSAEIEQCKLYIAAGMNITTMPGEPVDQLIGIMMLAKFAAITEERLLVGEVELSSVLSDGIIYLHGENENINDVVDPSWWHTSDLEHCDKDLLETEKVVTIHKHSIWRELDLQWPDIGDNTNDDHGNTVVFADFKKLDDTK